MMWLGLLVLPLCCHGWFQQPLHLGRHCSPPPPLLTTSGKSATRATLPSLSSAVTADNLANSNDGDDVEDEEYEYVEYDILTEAEFRGSEWLVGTVMEGNPNKIQETWARLAVDADGKNVAIWGDKSQGSWSFDVANQFLSISKESLFGKDIWAGVVDDYYFARGTVRGWNFLSAASVVGQWQAKRLGVDKDEAGVPPWFEKEEDNDELAVGTSRSDNDEKSPESDSSVDNA